MLSITVKGKLDELAKAVGTESPKKIRQQTAIAINATANKTRGALAKEVGRELATTQKEIRKTIDVAVKANASRLGATVRQRESARLPLRVFGPRQTKKGVSVRVSKREGRKIIPGAFIVERYNGNVYKRPGPTRATGGNRKGPSPWGVTIKNKLDKLVAKRDVEPELIKQVERRIRAINYKRAQG